MYEPCCAAVRLGGGAVLAWYRSAASTNGPRSVVAILVERSIIFTAVAIPRAALDGRTCTMVTGEFPVAPGFKVALMLFGGGGGERRKPFGGNATAMCDDVKEPPMPRLPLLLPELLPLAR